MTRFDRWWDSLPTWACVAITALIWAPLLVTSGIVTIKTLLICAAIAVSAIIILIAWGCCIVAGESDDAMGAR